MYAFSRQKHPFPARKGLSQENLISEHPISVQSQISRNVRDENETHL
jgi:hypothetical protein